MSLAQRLSTAALLLAVTGIAVSPAAQAHNDHHHHSHKKQKAYNKGYRKGYKRAVKNTYRPYYRSYAPVYAPYDVVCSSHPLHGWRQSIPTTTERVNVGFGFNL